MSSAASHVEKSARDRWLSIELRHLAALASVAQESSFSGAADSLGYVQSAVSQQINSLERIVGQRLVNRSARPRSSTVTPAGHALLQHVEEILTELRLAKSDIDAITRGSDRCVSIGIDALLGSWLPAAVFRALLDDEHGQMWERVERGSAQALLELVAAGRLDAAFVPLPIASGKFYAIELAREPYALVAPADPAGNAETVAEVVARWPLVEIDRCQATAAVRARTDRRRGSAPSLHAASGPVSALALVRTGAVSAVIPARDVPREDPAIRSYGLPEIPDCSVGLAWHRERDTSPPVCALRAAARQAFGPARR